MLIRGQLAEVLFDVEGWMSTFYVLGDTIYLHSVWNQSAAYYDVLIELTPEEAAQCRAGGEAYMTTFARQAINNGGYRDRLVRDYRP
ncbi:MAG: hypothetical protein RIT28_4790 [Pseudomonadota bacterium]